MIDLGSAGDAVLVVAIGRWREEALAEVYRRHGGAVHGLARRVVGSDALADEVTQDVFVDLWKRPERFDPGRGALRTFLLTSAHGKAVDVVRSESSRRAREERTARETVVAGYDPGPMVTPVADALVREIRRANITLRTCCAWKTAATGPTPARIHDAAHQRACPSTPRHTPTPRP